MTTQWGAPLTGVQMQRLQDAGLRACGFKMTGESQVDDKGVVTKTYDKYHLPADHAAYTLANAGWLDGRNVALWFGGEKAPDDWDEGSDVLFRGGVVPFPSTKWAWKHRGSDGDIIAYTRKAEGLTTHADRVLADAERAAKRMGGELGQNELWGAVEAASGEAAKADACAGCHGLNTSCPDGCFDGQHETVTIAKMTEADSREWCRANFGGNAPDCWEVLNALNLIKPEPSREDRFWASQPNGGAHVTDDVKAWVREALEF